MSFTLGSSVLPTAPRGYKHHKPNCIAAVSVQITPITITNQPSQPQPAGIQVSNPTGHTGDAGKGTDK